MAHLQPQGFLAVSPSGNGPGVLVLHAWWGLNDTIKAFCTRLAESGFVAFAHIDNLEEPLRRAGRPVTFYRYSGTGHTASLAWERTLAFLKRASTL